MFKYEKAIIKYDFGPLNTFYINTLGRHGWIFKFCRTRNCLKRSPSHIAFSFFLAFSILFSQVGLSYLHDKHDAHEHLEQSDKNQTQLHKHGEHCKVCAIDLFSGLPSHTEIIFLSPEHATIASSLLYSDLSSLPVERVRGRAPPVALS